MKHNLVQIIIVFVVATSAHSQTLNLEEFAPLAEHQTCEVDSDCISFTDECEACRCCMTINKTHLQMYKDTLREEFQNLQGGVCNWDCPAYAICEEGKCEFSVFPPEDRSCESPADCITVWTSCDDCECGSPINKKHQQKYEDLKKEKCKDYSGGMCDIYCPESHLDCEEGRCVMVNEDILDGVDLRMFDRCKDDADCIAVEEYRYCCGERAINKKHKEWYLKNKDALIKMSTLDPEKCAVIECAGIKGTPECDEKSQRCFIK